MSTVQEFSNAQLFFLAFVVLSLPVFLYFYIKPAIEGTPPELQTHPSSEGSGTADEVSKLDSPRRSTGFPLANAAAPSWRDDTAKPAGPCEPAHLSSSTEEVDRRGEVFASGSAPGTLAHDIVILPLRQKPPALLASEGGFPRYQVPGSHSFQIVLEVKGLLEPQELELEMASSAANEGSGSLVAEIGEGEKVGLSLECLPGSENERGDEPPIDIDATHQAFSLCSRPVTAIFLAHSRAVETATKADMSLRVTAGRLEIGTIDFEITVYPARQAPEAAV